ncbi:MAG TPA: hypothetical protein VHY91_11200 [Pirellulales bacterium]|nr:hypothetical protein [Pirellulales bacterium]
MRRKSILHLLWTTAPACLALLPAVLSLPGCGPSDEVLHYQAVALKQPEPPPVEPPEAVDRTLAAIVVHPSGSKKGAADSDSPAEAAWFFKLSGPVAAVAAQTEAFEKFVSSVHFVDDAPQYDPPADWQPQGAGPMRYETFVIPGEQRLELAISTFPKLEADETAFLLANVNRWRGQLGLGQIGEDELAGSTRQLPLAEGTATLVDLVGKLKQTGMGSQVAPFSGAGNGK